jgi:hypothetical protein
MNKLFSFTLLISIFSLSACSTSPESALRKNTETLLVASLNDASSYEFVAIDDLKALTIADTLLLHLDYSIMPLRKSMQILMESRSDLLVSQLRLCAYTSECNDSLLTETRKAYEADSIAYSEISEKTKELLDRVSLPESKQTEIGYKALFKYRANNSNGAKELREIMVYSDQNYNLFDRYIKIKP